MPSARSRLTIPARMIAASSATTRSGAGVSRQSSSWVGAVVGSAGGAAAAHEPQSGSGISSLTISVATIVPGWPVSASR